jgi:hypothetical protein
MASSGMLRPVALVITNVSEELISSQRASVASCGYVPSSTILITLMMEALSSTETSFLTRATRHNIPEEVIQRSSSNNSGLHSLSLKTPLSFESSTSYVS